MRPLNGDFEAWNQGTSFTNPSFGTETADSWFANGSVGVIISRSADSHSGTYSMEVQSGSEFVTPDQFISITPGTIDHLEVSVWVKVLSTGSGQDAGILIQDGYGELSIGGGGSFPDTWFHVTGTYPINPLADTIHVVMHTGPGTKQLYDDFTIAYVFKPVLTESVAPSSAIDVLSEQVRNLSDIVTSIDAMGIAINPVLKIVLADGVGLADSIMIETTNKVFAEATVMQDWLRVRKSPPQDNWS